MLNFKPIHIAVLAAVLSGISVFINSLAVKGIDPFAFTTMKNVFVALGLFAGILLFGQRNKLLSLSRSQLSNLLVIGFIGGSIPFLLFFWGLSISTGTLGSFFYRLLFVFASAIAVFYLKEKLDVKLLVGGALLLIGNALLIKGSLVFGLGEALIVLATVLWAIETNISKKVLTHISPSIVVLGRMFFGALIMLGTLAVFGKLGPFLSFTPIAWEWVAITALFLLSYVTVFYTALSKLPVSVATPVMTLGGPITALLAWVAAGKALLPIESLGMLLIVTGVAVIANLSEQIRLLLRPATHGVGWSLFACS
jgi:drug/metabolite transporter (DMT)-like permease